MKQSSLVCQSCLVAQEAGANCQGHLKAVRLKFSVETYRHIRQQVSLSLIIQAQLSIVMMVVEQLMNLVISHKQWFQICFMSGIYTRNELLNWTTTVEANTAPPKRCAYTQSSVMTPSLTKM